MSGVLLQHNNLLANKYDFPIFFYKIKEKKVVWSRYELQPSSCFLVLQEKTLTKEDPAAAELAGAVIAWNKYEEIYYKAKREYIETGKVKGYECLSCEPGDSNTKFWVSHYDLNFLEK
jgi:hypothetical protein